VQRTCGEAAIRGTGRKAGLEPIDGVLLVAFVVVAGLGTWMRCLMVNDAAVCLTAAWLGNAWDLCLAQVPARALSSLLLFGPAWAARSNARMTSSMRSSSALPWPRDTTFADEALAYLSSQNVSKRTQS
jgi:hypothetical protein